MEVTTGVHRRVADAVDGAGRAAARSSSRALAAHGLRAAVAGMHPSAVWSDTVVSVCTRATATSASRCACSRAASRRSRRTSTSGSRRPRAAVRLLNRLRVHLPLLLALSANSPFWQGRATGFASTRTTVFDAFPRTGGGACLSRLRRLGRARRRAAAVRCHRGSVPAVVGRQAAAALRHGRGPHHGCPASRSRTSPPSLPWSSRWRCLELERPHSPGRRAGDQRAHRREPLPGGARRDAGPPDRRRFRQAHRRPSTQLDDVLAACRPWAAMCSAASAS